MPAPNDDDSEGDMEEDNSGEAETEARVGAAALDAYGWTAREAQALEDALKNAAKGKPSRGMCANSVARHPRSLC